MGAVAPGRIQMHCATIEGAVAVFEWCIRWASSRREQEMNSSSSPNIWISF